MLTEQQLFIEFQRYAVVTARDGAPYLEVLHALELVAACQQNDLAVLGIDGHVAHRSDRRLSRRDDLIVDCSGIEASTWKEFRDMANSFAQAFLRQHEQEPHLVFEFVLWSASERAQAQSSGIEVDTGAPDGRKLRFSNKMVKLLPRRGWTIEMVVDTYRNPAHKHATIDKTRRPPQVSSGPESEEHS